MWLDSGVVELYRSLYYFSIESEALILYSGVFEIEDGTFEFAGMMA